MSSTSLEVLCYQWPKTLLSKANALGSEVTKMNGIRFEVIIQTSYKNGCDCDTSV